MTESGYYRKEGYNYNRKGKIELGSYKVVNINKKYATEVLDPVRIIVHIFYNNSLASNWLIKDGILIGGQGSGKSSAINYICSLVVGIELYRKNGIVIIKTNDPRIIGDERYDYMFEGVKYVVLIVDDMMGLGMDSRRAMKSENVEITSFYNTIRHKLKDKWKKNPKKHSKNGIIFVLFANQVWSRVDPTLRENAMFKIFTSYTDQDWFFKELRYHPNCVKDLRVATFEGDLGDKYEKKAINIMKLKTGQASTIITNYINDDKYNKYMEYWGIKSYEVLRDMSNKDLHKTLLKYLVNKYKNPLETKVNIMKAYLQIKAEELKENYSISYTDSDLSRVINTAKMIMWDVLEKKGG